MAQALVCIRSKLLLPVAHFFLTSPLSQLFLARLTSKYSFLGLNIFLIFIPFAWAAHFIQDSNPEAFGGHAASFACKSHHLLQLYDVDKCDVREVAFLAIMPLEKLFDFGGEQLAMYCGEDIGDLILITLNK